MLRTIVVRTNFLRGHQLRKITRANLTRTLTVQCVRRIPHNLKSFKHKQNQEQWTYRILRYYSSKLPPHTKVTLPALSPTMEEGTVVSWAKKEGDKLSEGDLLAEIETDKATMAFETPEEGYLAKIVIPAGTKGVPIGKLVCIIVENEADVAAFKDYKDDGTTAASKEAPAPTPEAPAPAVPSTPAPSPSAAASHESYPHHVKVTLPALSPTMEEGTLIAWSKKEGDKLSEGELLAEIETDKATMGFETPEEGYLAKILIPAGTKGIPIGKLMCIIVENEEDVAAFSNYKGDVARPSSITTPIPPTPASQTPTPSVPITTGGRVSPMATHLAERRSSRQQGPPQTSAPPSGRVYASPLAKTLAEQKNIKLQGKGSGMYDSITSKDVDKLAASAPVQPTVPASTAPKAKATTAAPSPAAVIPPGAAYVDIPVTNIRATIAKRLLESKTRVPHYYLTIHCRVDKLLAIRDKFNKNLEKEKLKLSVNDFIIKACAMACKKVPEANSYWMDNVIRQFKNVDVSVAVATEKGLITPIIFEANNKGLVEISRDIKALAAKAREGKLQPNEYQGGTFSVSNLGMFGVDHFCAIINPPQSCILAVGTTSKQLIKDDESEKGFKEANFLSVTLSSDHRTVDGAVGAQWLKYFRQYMEDPESMLL